MSGNFWKKIYCSLIFLTRNIFDKSVNSRLFCQFLMYFFEHTNEISRYSFDLKIKNNSPNESGFGPGICLGSVCLLWNFRVIWTAIHDSQVKRKSGDFGNSSPPNDQNDPLELPKFQDIRLIWESRRMVQMIQDLNQE